MPSTGSTPPTDDAWGELGDLVAAAHERDIEVWLDVVFNHTTEIDETGPTYHFRGLADGDYYALDGDGGYIETSGCGNDIDTSSAAARDIVIESLERFADAGIDGFRFDLAPVVVRHRPFVTELDGVGRPTRRADDRRAVGRLWRLPARRGVARARLAAVERPLP